MRREFVWELMAQQACLSYATILTHAPFDVDQQVPCSTNITFFYHPLTDLAGNELGGVGVDFCLMSRSGTTLSTHSLIYDISLLLRNERGGETCIEGRNWCCALLDWCNLHLQEAPLQERVVSTPSTLSKCKNELFQQPSTRANELQQLIFKHCQSQYYWQ